MTVLQINLRIQILCLLLQFLKLRDSSPMSNITKKISCVYIPNFLHAVACEILVVTKTQKAIFLHNTKKFVVENLLVFGVDLRLRQN